MKKSLVLSIALVCALATTKTAQAGQCFSTTTKVVKEIAKYVGPALQIAEIFVTDLEGKEIIGKVSAVHEAVLKLRAAEGDTIIKQAFDLFNAACAAGSVEISDENKVIVGILVSAGLMAFDGTVPEAVQHLGPKALEEIVKRQRSRAAYSDAESFNQIIFNAVCFRGDVTAGHLDKGTFTADH